MLTGIAATNDIRDIDDFSLSDQQTDKGPKSKHKSGCLEMVPQIAKERCRDNRKQQMSRPLLSLQEPEPPCSARQEQATILIL
jgi:hypothetical protein